MPMIADIWTNDIDSAGASPTLLPKGGSKYASPNGAVTSPMYFAPAYYAAFKAAGDSTHLVPVQGLIAIRKSALGSKGLESGARKQFPVDGDQDKVVDEGGGSYEAITGIFVG